MIKDIKIYGAGGAGRELASKLKGRVLGVIDDTKTQGDIIDSLPVLGGFDSLTNKDDVIVCIVADPKVKKALIEKIKSKLPGVDFLSVFCENNTISDNVQWGEGSIVAHPYNIICPGVRVGRFVWINAKNSIGYFPCSFFYQSIKLVAQLQGLFWFSTNSQCVADSFVLHFICAKGNNQIIIAKNLTFANYLIF